MKKHFLLLLMAFMSLTGYAINLDGSKFSALNIPYGSTALPVVSKAVGYEPIENTDYTVDYDHFYTSADGTGEIAVVSGETNILKTTAPGEYFIKVSGTGTYMGSYVYVSFLIYPSIITIDFTDGQSKTYGEDDPEGGFTYSLALNGEAVATDAAKAALVEASGLWVSREKVGTTEGEKAGTYAYTFGTRDEYYQIARLEADAENKFTINPKNIAGTFAISLAEGTWTYNGANQNPDITVKDGENEIDANQFAFAYSYATTATGVYAAVDAHANAGFYKVTASTPVGSNYSLAGADDADLVAGPFQIAKATLNIYVNSFEKEYDGNVDDLSTATIAYSGLQGADAESANPFDNEGAAFVAEYKTAGDANKNFGPHTLKATNVPAKTNAKLANYNYNLLETGKLTVTAKAITVKPTDNEKAFGTDDPEFALTVTGAVADDVATIQGAYDITRDAGEELGTYTMTATQKAELADATKTLLKNYNITPEPGTFTISGGTLYVYPKSVSVVYGTQTPTFTVVATTAGGTEVELTTKPTVKFKDAAYASADPTDAGTYVLTLEGDAVAENYATVVKLDGQYTITQKTLIPQVATQTLQAGEGLDQSKVKFVDNDGKDGLVGEDKIAYVLAFNTGDEVGQMDEGELVDGATAGTKVIKADPTNAIYDQGIKISAPAEIDAAVYANKNYAITFGAAFGKLIVGTGHAEAESSITFLDTDANLVTNINGVAGETYKHVKIKFASRNGRKYTPSEARTYPWIAEKWTTMVLPFDISVANLSKALGYAIVNVINPEKTKVSGIGSEFWGKVVMNGGNGKDDVLAANKPFMLKIAGDLDPDEAYDFGQQTIVAVPSDLSVAAAKEENVTFVGTYANKTVTKADNAAIWFMNGNEDGWQYIGASSSASWTIAPFEAYIDMSSVPAGARSITFNFEDIDGTVTAIKSINAENLNKNMSREGWYNLNGVKLQGAPTQKGIYIQNGKKVVVK